MRSIAWLVVVAACSGHSGEPSHPNGSNAPIDTSPAVAALPSERECDDLAAHAVALGMAELRAQQPANQLPTEAEQARLIADLRAEPGCRTMSRDTYRCAIAAKAIAELGACHSTRSSSTSNSSVAPGGMAPPAPRSP